MQYIQWSQVIHSQTKILELSECDIKDAGLSHIANTCKRLIKIDLNSAKDSRTTISSDGRQYMAKAHEIGTSRVEKNWHFTLFTMFNIMAVSNTWIIGFPCPTNRVIQSSLVFAWSAFKVGSFGWQNHPVFYVIHKIQVTFFAFIMYKVIPITYCSVWYL